MKKRRVQADELKKMKQAVFIWYNPVGNLDRGKWRASNALLQLHGELHAEFYGKKIFAQSLEELLLRLVVEHPGEKLYCVDSALANEFTTLAYEFTTPAYIDDLLREDIVVNEVVL